MPKRDASYMEEQRRTIAHAARRCILEKGWAATSTRDVCKYAQISKGALYVHFKTREELFAAVGELDEWMHRDPASTWADYEARIVTLIDSIATTEIHRKLMSASYEFLSEIVRTNLTPPRVHAECDSAYAFYKNSLRVIHERGEISLPLGLEQTMRLHIQIQSGAIFCMLADGRQDYAQLRRELLQSLGHTAGLRKAAVRQNAKAVTGRVPAIDQQNSSPLPFPAGSSRS